MNSWFGHTVIPNKVREGSDWYLCSYCRHETGKFPDLPEEEEGGSSAIVGMVHPDDDNLSDDSRSQEKKVGS